jgi:hypothetical protein
LRFLVSDCAGFLKAADKAAGATRTFCGLLHHTGCSLTQGLTLTPAQVDFSARTVILQGTTPRRHDIKRTTPVPDSFIALLDEVHDIRRAQSGPNADRLVGRTTESSWLTG